MDGLETAEMESSNPGNIIASPVVFVRIAPEKLRIGTLAPSTALAERQTVKDLVNSSSKALLGINANFFDKEGQPLGLLIRDGILIHKPQIAGKLLNGILTVKRGEISISGRTGQEKDLLIEGVDSAFQSGPLLVLGGKGTPVGEFPDENNRRSVAAIDGNGNLLLLITRSRFPGMSLVETQNLLLCPALNIKSAINFDGGSSSQLYLKKIGPLTAPIDITGGERVPAALGVFLR